MENEEKKIVVQVIYKCHVGNLEKDAVEAYLETELTRVKESMNVDGGNIYNITVIPMYGQYSTIEVLPVY